MDLELKTHVKSPYTVVRMVFSKTDIIDQLRSEPPSTEMNSSDLGLYAVRAMTMDILRPWLDSAYTKTNEFTWDSFVQAVTLPARNGSWDNNPDNLDRLLKITGVSVIAQIEHGLITKFMIDPMGKVAA